MYVVPMSVFRVVVKVRMDLNTNNRSSSRHDRGFPGRYRSGYNVLPLVEDFPFLPETATDL